MIGIEKMAAAERESWDESQLRKYTFPTDSLPRLSFKDRKASELIAQGEPVVLTDTDLVTSALHWSTDYLKENLGDGNFSVYESDNHLFKYFDEKKLSSVKDFTPPMRRREMKFGEFCDSVASWQPGDRRLYLQQPLNNTVGDNIVKDFVKFNWQFVTSHQQRNQWGPLTSNLLLLPWKAMLHLAISMSRRTSLLSYEASNE